MTPAKFEAECRRGAAVFAERHRAQLRERVVNLVAKAGFPDVADVEPSVDKAVDVLAENLVDAITADVVAALPKNKMTVADMTEVDWQRYTYPALEAPIAAWLDRASVTVDPPAASPAIEKMALATAETALAVAIASLRKSPDDTAPASQAIQLSFSPRDRDALVRVATALAKKPDVAAIIETLAAALKPPTGDLTITHDDGTTTTMRRSSAPPAAASSNQAKPPAARPQLPARGPANQANAREFYREQDTSDRAPRSLDARGRTP